MPNESLDSFLTEEQIFHGFSGAQVAMVLTNPNLEDDPIVYVNQAFTRTTGYSRKATIGRNCRFLQGDKTDKRAVDLLRGGLEAGETVTVDLMNYRASGEAFMNRLMVTPIYDRAGRLQYHMGIQKELRHGEQANSAEEISAQLTEVQVRTQSDVSMIISMIRQQSGATTVPADYAALSRRIETLQLLYEEMKLADLQTNRDTVQMGSYLSRLACAIAHNQSRAGIRINLQIETLEVPIETATRIGLVLSELLTNAYEHAFERMDMGLVEVRMSQLSAGGLRLIVSDDGVGVPGRMSWPNPSTTGGRIITGLIEGLEGTLHLGRGAAGSFITIDVPAGASLTQ